MTEERWHPLRRKRAVAVRTGRSSLSGSKCANIAALPR